MHVGQRYKLSSTLRWSQRELLIPAIWALVATALYGVAGFTFLSVPWLPMSLLGVAVAFYLGFKNNASYDRTWEARKIWGAIVNASRSWAYSARDLVTDQFTDEEVSTQELKQIHDELVLRHVAWLDALRHQLRKVKSWEHTGPLMERYRKASVPEYSEDLAEVLRPNLPEGEGERVLAMINPAAHLIARQSQRLAELRRRDLLDGFAHMELVELLQELMAQQGKAERIKNFPFPRQYSTVNRFFALLFCFLLPFGLLKEFSELGPLMVWMTVPFSTLVSWVFLTADKIGDWSENPFEGLANDVPISSMARGIERDIRQMIGQSDLPPPRPIVDMLQY